MIFCGLQWKLGVLVSKLKISANAMIDEDFRREPLQSCLCVVTHR